MSALLENPFVFMYDGKLTQVKELLPILDYVAKQARPLLIVAEDIDGEALALLVVNKARGILKVAAVKAPEFGDKKTQILEDMAILTGGTVVSSTKGFRLDKFEIGWMGQCRLATVDKHTTTIVDGKGDEALIEARLLELKSQIDKSTSPYEVEKLQERLSKMIGGVAIIHVGANTEVELKEKKDRVDDALHATKAALEEGILPGGGTALLYARESITLKNKLDSSDIRAGKAIMYSVCGAPFHKILSNAGYSSESIYPIMQSARKKTKLNKGLYFGFNIKKEKIVNMVEEGIIDPTKVVRSALENATSVATTILLTEGCIFSEKEKNEESTGMNGFEGMM
jgi:chaperonin GroEL